MTPDCCQCEGPGYCPLMKRRMSQVRFEECRDKPHYFEMFLKEAGKSPAREIPQTDWDQSPCIHLGKVVEVMSCVSCGGESQSFETRECAIYGVCSERPRDSAIDACYGCQDYKPTPPSPP